MEFFSIRKSIIVTVCFVFSITSFSQTKNVGIGTLLPDSSAILHLEASDKGILIPRVFLQSVNDVTTILNPANALLVYNTNSSLPGGTGFFYWNLTQWIQAIGPMGPMGPPGPTNVDSLIVSYASFDTLFASYANFDSLFINGTSIDSFVSNMIDTIAWKQQGNTGTSPSVNFLGTIDSVDLVLKTNNIEQARISADGGTSVSSLAGSGTRMVTADAAGLLNTQPIPYGIPQGGIIMWSGTIANIPSGWALCDGTNGTPDLTDKFILSVSSVSEDPGATGGAHSYSLTTAELPSHNHTGTSNSDGDHLHSEGTLVNSSVADHAHTLTSAATNSTGSHSHTLTAASAGTAGSHNHSGSSIASENSHEHTVRGNDSFSGGGSSFETDNSSNNQPRSTINNNGHSHTLTISSDGSHSHPISGSTDAAGNHNHSLTGPTDAAGSHAHTISGSTANAGIHAHTFTTDNTGSGAGIDNRPSFFKLAYIMKL